jgi:hypothetical protein
MWSSVPILLTNHWSGSCKRGDLYCTEFVIYISGYPLYPCLIQPAARRPVSMRFRLAHVQKASMWSKHNCKMTMGRDSLVGIATRYELGGPWIESRWESDIFLARSDRPLYPPGLLCNGYLVFPGGKSAGAWRWTPPSPTSSAEVKERVEIYLYYPSGPSWPVLGWTLLQYNQ